MKDSELNRIIEALLFASPEPLTQTKVNGIFSPDTPNLKSIIEILNKKYEKESHAFEIKNIAGGFQLVSKKEYEIYIRKMLKKSHRITHTHLELLTTTCQKSSIHYIFIEEK